MIVLKFGGTSVGSPEAIRNAARIVGTRADRSPVVVASAMAGVTDRLVSAAGQAGRGCVEEALEGVAELEARHRAALSELAGGEPAAGAQARLDGLLAGLADAVRALGSGGRSEGDLLRATDAVLGHGELLSTTLLATGLEAAGHEVEWVDAREVVVTDDRFGRAAPREEELGPRARHRLGRIVRDGRIPVTQGFIGATVEGAPTTLGRGGSDFTAALLGRALAVEEVEIWTDVHGLMTADPRVVPDARPLADATYDEAAELAFFGARVLHPATLIPVIEEGVPVRILNSGDPGAGGTRISAVPTGRPGEVKSIASRSHVTTLSLQAPRMLGTHGFLRRMFEVFDRYGVSLDVVSTSEVSVSVSVDGGALSDGLVEELEELGRVVVRPDRAIICVVGESLRETPGVAERIFRAVAPVNVEMISQGGSGINVTLVVAGGDAAEAVRLLHREFFPEPG